MGLLKKKNPIHNFVFLLKGFYTVSNIITLQFVVYSIGKIHCIPTSEIHADFCCKFSFCAVDFDANSDAFSGANPNPVY